MRKLQDLTDSYFICFVLFLVSLFFCFFFPLSLSFWLFFARSVVYGHVLLKFFDKFFSFYFVFSPLTLRTHPAEV